MALIFDCLSQFNSVKYWNNGIPNWHLILLVYCTMKSFRLLCTATSVHEENEAKYVSVDKTINRNKGGLKSEK